MAILSPRLRRLDAALADLPADSDAMLLSELDGYLAGVIVCPELILPGEWLPAIWGSDDDGSPFADEREAQWYVELITEHYNAVIRTLARGRGRSSRSSRWTPGMARCCGSCGSRASRPR